MGATMDVDFLKSNQKKRVLGFGIISFLALATISNTVTTDFSYAIISISRIFLFLCVLLSLFFLFFSKAVRFQQLYASLIFLILTFFALVTAVLGSVSSIYFVPLFVDVPLILAGIFLLFLPVRSPWPSWLSEWFAFYALIVAGVTFIIGGLYFDPLPKFNFEFGSGLIGREETYSLGISYFYGLASLSALIAALRRSDVLVKSFFYGCFLFYIVLCFIGGGRGEIVIALLVVFLIFSVRGFPLFLGVLFFSLITLVLFFVFRDYASQFAVFERFSMLIAGDFSSRDNLLLEGGRLLIHNPHCLLSGCGFGFFQSYHGYEFGLYPHNSLLESVIVFGLPVTLFIVFSYMRGVFLYLKYGPGVDLFLAFSAYAALVSLKSQYIYGALLFIVSIFYFCWLGLRGRTAIEIRSSQ